MFKWLWRCFGWHTANSIEYDAVYGLSRRSLDDWFALNPKLAAEHKILEQAASDRRRKATGKPGPDPSPTKNI